MFILQTCTASSDYLKNNLYSSSTSVHSFRPSFHPSFHQSFYQLKGGTKEMDRGWTKTGQGIFAFVCLCYRNVWSFHLESLILFLIVQCFCLQLNRLACRQSGDREGEGKTRMEGGWWRQRRIEGMKGVEDIAGIFCPAYYGLRVADSGSVASVSSDASALTAVWRDALYLCPSVCLFVCLFKAELSRTCCCWWCLFRLKEFVNYM